MALDRHRDRAKKHLRCLDRSKRSMAISTVQAKPKSRLLARPWMVCVLGVLVSLFGGYLAWQNGRSLDDAAFHRQTMAYLSAFQERRNSTEDLLVSLRSLFHVKPDLSLEEFRESITGLAIRLNDVQALGWAPIVSRGDREAFEAAGRKAVAPGFEIRDGDPSTSLMRAAARDDYFPLLYLDPVEGNEHLLGIDMSVGDVGGSFVMARRDGQVTLTPRVRVRFKEGVVEGLLAFMAVYRPVLRPQTDEERQKLATGFVASFIVIGEAMKSIAGRIPSFDLDVLLKDITKDQFAGVMGVFSNGGAEEQARLRDEGYFKRKRFVEQPVLISSRSWVFLFRRGANWADRSSPLFPAAVVGCGLLLTMVLWQHLRTTSQRTEEVERLVELRTAELSAAMDRLEQGPAAPGDGAAAAGNPEIGKPGCVGGRHRARFQ